MTPSLNTFNGFLNSLKDIHSKLKINENVDNIIKKLKDTHIKNNNLSVYARASPIISASCFPKGYVLFNILDKKVLDKKVLDKKVLENEILNNLTFWITVKSRGVKKWSPYVNKFGFKINKILYFADKKTKFLLPHNIKNNLRQISDLYIEKTLLIGEGTIISTKVPSGIYSVYDYKDCCIICPKKSFDKIFTNFFTKINGQVNIDRCSYGFYNGEIYSQINEIMNPPKNMIISSWGGSLPLVIECNSLDKKYFIIEKDMLMKELSPGNGNIYKLISKINEYKYDPVGILMLNGSSNGSLNIFHIKKENIYMIISLQFLSYMYDEIKYFLK